MNVCTSLISTTTFQMCCLYTQSPRNIYISVMTTLGGIGMVMYMTKYDNVNVFGLGAIDLLSCCCCGRASTKTCYRQCTHSMLLWACKKYCWCKYNIHEITLITSMNHLVADIYRWSWGRWRVANCYSKCSSYIWMLSSELIGYRYRRDPISCAMW